MPPDDNTHPETQTLEVRPGVAPGTVRSDDGEVLQVPNDWALLPPGDAGLTRRVKASGPTWTVREKRGRKVFSRGVWAHKARIDGARRALEVERADPAYAKRQAAAKRRREAEHARYVAEFESEVRAFLGFDPRYADVEEELAKRVAAHATPVGSGTVARTKRIAVDERARAAVMAWLRHQTTDYDHRHIAREKGRRREVRKELAKASRALLRRYRSGEERDEGCPLQRALARPAGSAVATVVPTGQVARSRKTSDAELTRSAQRTPRQAPARRPAIARTEPRARVSAAPKARWQGAPPSPRRPAPGRSGRFGTIARLKPAAAADRDATPGEADDDEGRSSSS